MTTAVSFVERARARALEFELVGNGEAAAALESWAEDAELAAMMGIDTAPTAVCECGAAVPIDAAVCGQCGRVPLPF